MPDWVACDPSLQSLAVAEAKGRFAPRAQTLDRAWDRANRIDVLAGGRRVAVQRFAVVTQWGVEPTDSQILVRSSTKKTGSRSTPAADSFLIDLFRLHIASLIRWLGHARLAEILRRLALQPSESDRNEARSALQESPVRHAEEMGVTGVGERLVGGVVTRAGPSGEVDARDIDPGVLARLDMRPVFVGVERDLIRAVIDGDIDSARSLLRQERHSKDFARSDRAGTWIVFLDESR